MKRTVEQHLLEVFGEPIGKTDAADDLEGVRDERGKRGHVKPPSNRNWGAKFEGASMSTCDQCGGMMGLDEDTCTSCGSMKLGLEEDQLHQASKKKAKKSKPKAGDFTRRDRDLDARNYAKYGSPSGWGKKEKDDGLDEVTPPGREKQVKALKKDKKVKNPWAVAWSSYNKAHENLVRETRDRVSPDEVMTTWEDLYVNSLHSRRKSDQHGGEPGRVSLEVLTSWLGTTEDAVLDALAQTSLVVDRHGNVVERGISTPPPPMN